MKSETKQLGYSHASHHTDAGQRPTLLGRERAAFLLQLLVWGSFVLGLTVTGWALVELPLGTIPVLLVVLALMFLAERFDVNAYGDAYVSVSVAGVVAALVLSGWAGAALVAGGCVIAVDILANRPRPAVLFNFGAAAGAASLGAVAYYVSSVTLYGREGYWLLIPAAAAALAIFFVESILVALAISTNEQRGLLSVWRNKFQWYMVHHVVLGIMGALIAIAYLEIGIIGAFSFMIPPLMLRFVMKQYVDKTAKTITELESSNRELAGANRAVRKMTSDLQRSYRETLQAIMAALDARDHDTHGHSGRVQMLTLELAREIGVVEGSYEWDIILHGSLLHDVGKIAVADNILRKPASLTDDEWVEMRKHPEAGANLLNQVSFLQGAAELVYAHHERWDGKGYPRGLKTEEIPLGARLFMIADTYDAMTRDRVYRKAQSPEASREEIVRCAGTQFDPAAVEAFLRIFPSWAARTRRERKEQRKQGQAA
ncbi:MAG: HD domain-containing phosphohydrolase [Dehalococcoidia bacterium]